ncbi:fatty acyl-CoA reductase 2, chloroplastic-like [Nymphaea colorata]|nr:fatty acyl-CoA reductase 2, chloroplastic-like [Nymphaea colorata]
MFSLGHFSFMSPPTMNATRLAAANQVPANYSVSFISPPHHLRSSTPQPASCTFNSFPVKSTQPAPLVSMVDRKRASQSKRALAVTRAGILTTPKEREVFEEEEDGCGLGIVEFLRDKNMLITGTTGFVGKLLIEKILRSQPDVGKLFLLIQGPNQEAVNERLKHEIINAELFKRLKGVHGSSYEAFMLSKLVPVVAHLGEDSLGLEEKVQKDIVDNVDVIVSCAANTRFDERYDVALNTNTNGASRLVKLARRCRKLQVFLHVSTAYVNGPRTGLIKERPFFLGDSIAREEAMATHSQEIPPILDIGEETKIIKDTLEGRAENTASPTPRMKELGLERAKIHGWQNVYSFTKAMGEMVIGSMSNDLPTVIVRPTIIGSTIQDPFPGWIQGLRMADPVIVYYGKGQFNVFTAEGKTILDLVPADMVINAILAAMARHGSSGVAGLNIYHVGTSSTNPLRVDELFNHCYEHFHSFPLIDSQGKFVHIERMNFFDTLEAISSYLSAGENGRLKKARDMHILRKLSVTYEPYTSYKGRFDIANAKKLMKRMSRVERNIFTFDVAAIDWRDYIVNVHIPGLRKHIISGDAS